MKKDQVILVADRNPRIRDFIQRELKSEGHRVFTAENADQLRSWINRPGQLDVLVIDPDMPGLDDEEQLGLMLSVRPTLTVIFHCLVSELCTLKCPERQVAFVEKSGQSVDVLKQKIGWLFNSPLYA